MCEFLSRTASAMRLKCRPARRFHRARTPWPDCHSAGGNGPRCLDEPAQWQRHDMVGRGKTDHTEEQGQSENDGLKNGEPAGVLGGILFQQVHDLIQMSHVPGNLGLETGQGCDRRLRVRRIERQQQRFQLPVPASARGCDGFPKFLYFADLPASASRRSDSAS